jgi:hypothetical protein
MIEDSLAVSPRHVSVADYWRERAIKARRLAQQHGDPATRDHLMKIVAGTKNSRQGPKIRHRQRGCRSANERPNWFLVVGNLCQLLCETGVCLARLSCMIETAPSRANDTFSQIRSLSIG